MNAAQRSLVFPFTLFPQQGRPTVFARGYLTRPGALQTQLEALNLETLQLHASVDLIRALGGGWESSKTADLANNRSSAAR